MQSSATSFTHKAGKASGLDFHNDSVIGAPRLILRLEGAALLTAACLAYLAASGSWLLFAVLFLVPDIFMLGYIKNNRVGALVYNIGHSTLLPLMTAGYAYYASMPLLMHIGLIWIAHVGFDRLVGYGLKYADAFKHTHLGTPGH